MNDETAAPPQIPNPGTDTSASFPSPATDSPEPPAAGAEAGEAAPTPGVIPPPPFLVPPPSFAPSSAGPAVSTSRPPTPAPVGPPRPASSLGPPRPGRSIPPAPFVPPPPPKIHEPPEEHAAPPSASPNSDNAPTIPIALPHPAAIPIPPPHAVPASAAIPASVSGVPAPPIPAPGIPMSGIPMSGIPAPPIPIPPPPLALSAPAAFAPTAPFTPPAPPAPPPPSTPPPPLEDDVPLLATPTIAVMASSEPGDDEVPTPHPAANPGAAAGLAAGVEPGWTPAPGPAIANLAGGVALPPPSVQLVSTDIEELLGEEDISPESEPPPPRPVLHSSPPKPPPPPTPAPPRAEVRSAELSSDVDLEISVAEDEPISLRDEPAKPPPPPHISTPPAAVPPPPPPAALQPPPPPPQAAPPPPPPQATAPKSEPRSKPAETGKKRGRPWWEEMFDDDFLRSIKQPTARQINDEVSFIDDRLGLQKGAVVLDVACGNGRHAIGLTKRGYKVVGFDLSLAMMARAQDEAESANEKINFIHGDMREMTFENMFDGICFWGMSFGYFEEEKNFAVLQRLCRALRPGGVLLMDVCNRDYIACRQPNMVWFEGDGCICMDETNLDFITSRLKVKRTVMLEDGRTRELDYSIRLYGLNEMGKLLHEAGFKVLEVSGQIATPGVFFGSESPRCIVLAERS